MPHIIIETSSELASVVRFEDNFVKLHNFFYKLLLMFSKIILRQIVSTWTIEEVGMKIKLIRLVQWSIATPQVCSSNLELKSHTNRSVATLCKPGKACHVTFDIQRECFISA